MLNGEYVYIALPTDVCCRCCHGRGGPCPPDLSNDKHPETTHCASLATKSTFLDAQPETGEVHLTESARFHSRGFPADVSRRNIWNPTSAPSVYLPANRRNTIEQTQSKGTTQTRTSATIVRTEIHRETLE